MAISTATKPKAVAGKSKTKVSAKQAEANRLKTIGSSEPDMGPKKSKAKSKKK
jgi:hypothetical protein